MQIVCYVYQDYRMKKVTNFSIKEFLIYFEFYIIPTDHRKAMKNYTRPYHSMKNNDLRI